MREARGRGGGAASSAPCRLRLRKWSKLGRHRNTGLCGKLKLSLLPEDWWSLFRLLKRWNDSPPKQRLPEGLKQHTPPTSRRLEHHHRTGSRCRALRLPGRGPAVSRSTPARPPPPRGTLKCLRAKGTTKNLRSTQNQQQTKSSKCISDFLKIFLNSKFKNKGHIA